MFQGEHLDFKRTSAIEEFMFMNFTLPAMSNEKKIKINCC